MAASSLYDKDGWWAGDGLTATHFRIGSIDEAARFRPTRHIFPEERLPWLHLREDAGQAG